MFCDRQAGMNLAGNENSRQPLGSIGGSVKNARAVIPLANVISGVERVKSASQDRTRLAEFLAFLKSQQLVLSRLQQRIAYVLQAIQAYHFARSQLNESILRQKLTLYTSENASAENCMTRSQFSVEGLISSHRISQQSVYGIIETLGVISTLSQESEKKVDRALKNSADMTRLTVQTVESLRQLMLTAKRAIDDLDNITVNTRNVYHHSKPIVTAAHESDRINSRIDYVNKYLWATISLAMRYKSKVDNTTLWFSNISNQFLHAQKTTVDLDKDLESAMDAVAGCIMSFDIEVEATFAAETKKLNAKRQQLNNTTGMRFGAQTTTENKEIELCHNTIYEKLQSKGSLPYSYITVFQQPSLIKDEYVVQEAIRAADPLAIENHHGISIESCARSIVAFADPKSRLLEHKSAFFQLYLHYKNASAIQLKTVGSYKEYLITNMTELYMWLPLVLSASFYWDVTNMSHSYSAAMVGDKRIALSLKLDALSDRYVADLRLIETYFEQYFGPCLINDFIEEAIEEHRLVCDEDGVFTEDDSHCKDDESICTTYLHSAFPVGTICIFQCLLPVWLPPMICQLDRSWSIKEDEAFGRLQECYRHAFGTFHLLDKLNKTYFFAEKVLMEQRQEPKNRNGQ